MPQEGRGGHLAFVAAEAVTSATSAYNAPNNGVSHIPSVL